MLEYLFRHFPMFVSVFILMELTAVLYAHQYFKSRSGWKAVFAIGVFILAAAYMGDLLDGVSEPEALRNFRFLQSLGLMIILFGVRGTHWQKFRKPLYFKTIFHRFMKDEKDG